MPVRVHVPVTIRLPAQRRMSSADLADLEVATGDALIRAFDVVRREVLVPRGRGRVVTVGDPSMRFATAVDEGLRADVATAVSRAVEHAVSASELRTWHRPSGPITAFTQPPTELVDPTRVGDGSYRVAVYDDGSRRAIPAISSGDPQSLTFYDAVTEAWRAHRERFGPRWDPAAYGYPGYYGSFVDEGKRHVNTLIYISRVTSISEDGWASGVSVQGTRFTMVHYDEDTKRIGRVSLSPAMGHWLLTRTETPGTVENVTRHFEGLAVARPADYPADPAVRAQIAEEVANPQALIYTLVDGATEHFITAWPGTADRGIAHSPIRFIVEEDVRTDEEEATEGGQGGEGTEAEGGRTRQLGPRGGPLGEVAEGEGQVWPTMGLGDEKLVCEAFLGEPPVTSLAVGGEALEADMRELATMLDVDFCGYAGQFCLNAAKVIGGRAHTVGIASIYSTMKTAVTPRPDGGGNHGFVDIEPTQSPELRYMEALGDLAVRVYNLANEITRTYKAPANAHLIYWDDDHDFDPNPIAWSLRFWIELGPAFTNSCMYLYGETCRVILLQQLRSSHSGITARQVSFSETLTRFKEALGILGESVVKLSVLKQALAHAKRLDITGSVREVLSREPPEVYLGEGESYQPPAPIESIAARIVELLETARIEEQGDAVVARFDGRIWTKDDLDQGIGLRRAVLNQVDPLFLQVPDLDSLYHGFRRDPASAGTYLWDLLKQMLEANEEMTSETSDWDDGCFFALEASQWVEAKGGISSLGQRYELQGIHKLADDVLRPWTGGFSYYRAGVDRAIGRKANWDKFVNAFAIAGIIVLALLCAPLGALAVGVVTGVAGLVLTARDVMEANRLEALYRSLEDPEAILAWQDVQLARLMADLSIAFSIFDVIGVGKGARAIVAGVRVSLKEVAQQGLRTTVRGTLTSARKAILANMAEEVLRNALKQAFTQAAIVAAMQAVLPMVITPVLVPWIRGVALEHGTLPGIDAALGALTAGQPPVPVAVRGPLPLALPAAVDEPVAPVLAPERPAEPGRSGARTDDEEPEP